MTEAVVDLLEPVEIDEQHRAGPLLVPCGGQPRIQEFGHAAAVRKAGEGVILGELRGMLGRPALLRHVDGAAAESAKAAARVVLRRGGDGPAARILLSEEPDQDPFERGFARQQEGQGPAAGVVALDLPEKPGEACAEERLAAAQRTREAGADVGEAAARVGRPEPAVARLLEALHQLQGLGGVAERLDARAEPQDSPYRHGRAPAPRMWKGRGPPAITRRPRRFVFRRRREGPGSPGAWTRRLDRRARRREAPRTCSPPLRASTRRCAPAAA